MKSGDMEGPGCGWPGFHNPPSTHIQILISRYSYPDTYIQILISRYSYPDNLVLDFDSSTGFCKGYTEEEVGYNLSLVYGPELSGSVVHQVRHVTIAYGILLH